VLLESATNLRFGSVHCSLYIGVEASGYGEGSSSSSAIVRRSEEIETQAMDEAFLLGQPTMHNKYSNPSYKTMIASAVTQVMDPLLFDELGEDSAGAGGSAGDDDRNEEMQMSDKHSEHTLSPPQSPSLANFADNTAAEVTLTSLPADILDDDDGDDDSSQESADLFHVDVAIADTLVDEELPEVVAGTRTLGVINPPSHLYVVVTIEAYHSAWQFNIFLCAPLNLHARVLFCLADSMSVFHCSGTGEDSPRNHRSETVSVGRREQRG
jgi:hypothetical protein